MFWAIGDFRHRIIHRWLMEFVPATYPFIIASLVGSSWLLLRMIRILRDPIPEFSSSCISSVFHYVIEDSRLVQQENPANPSDITVFVNPGMEERKFLTESLGTSIGAIHKCLDPLCPSNFAVKKRHLVLHFKTSRLRSCAERTQFSVSSIGVYIDTNSFKRHMTVVCQDTKLFDSPAFSHSLRTVDDVLVRLIWATVFTFEECLLDLSSINEELQSTLTTASENSQLLRMFNNAHAITVQRLAIIENDHAIELLCNYLPLTHQWDHTSHTARLLEEAKLESRQCCKIVDTLDSVASGLMDARAGIIGNNLSITMMNMNSLFIALAFPVIGATFGATSVFNSAIAPYHAISYSAMITGLSITAVTLFILLKKTFRWWS